MEGVQLVLEKIRDLLAPKENFSIVLTSAGTDWTTHISPPLYLNPKRRYELALVNLETYNSIPNITEANNHFVYSPDGIVWKTITLPEGSYELVQINTEIQRQLQANGDWNSNKKPTTSLWGQTHLHCAHSSRLTTQYIRLTWLCQLFEQHLASTHKR